MGHECDLAMLHVEDPTFWTGLEPLEFGPIPDLLEDVSVIGYPVGMCVCVWVYVWVCWGGGCVRRDARVCVRVCVRVFVYVYICITNFITNCIINCITNYILFDANSYY